MAQSNLKTEPNPVGLFIKIIQPSLILPILFDVEAPFPLQVNVFVVVSEEAIHGVRTSCDHPRGRVFWGSCVRLDLSFGRVRADHVGHFVH